MRSQKKSTAILPAVLAALMALATLGCNIDAVAGRFTYIVKYKVTANAAVTVDIDYTGGTPIVPPGPTTVNITNQDVDASTPWILELPAAFSYADGYFYPTLTVVENAGTFTSGETVTAKIIWKDYRFDFQEQVLLLDTVDGSAAVETMTLTGPELPRP